MTDTGKPIILELDKGFEAPSDGPIVLHLKKEKKAKSKRRYSRSLEEIQVMEHRLTRSIHRAARAGEIGIASYRERSDQSARKKKDGAVRDFIPNSGYAMSRALEEASPLPYELAQTFDTKQNRKRLRRQLRAFSRTLRAWRW